MKHGLLALLIAVLCSFVPAKTTQLEWAWIYECNWRQLSDETNNGSVWVPEFSQKIKALNRQEVQTEGYISRDAQGRFILTQFRRNPKSSKDPNTEAPNFILLDGMADTTYFAPLKKYEVKGFLQLNDTDHQLPAISLQIPEIIRNH